MSKETGSLPAVPARPPRHQLLPPHSLAAPPPADVTQLSPSLPTITADAMHYPFTIPVAGKKAKFLPRMGETAVACSPPSAAICTDHDKRCQMRSDRQLLRYSPVAAARHCKQAAACSWPPDVAGVAPGGASHRAALQKSPGDATPHPAACRTLPGQSCSSPAIRHTIGQNGGNI